MNFALRPLRYYILSLTLILVGCQDKEIKTLVGIWVHEANYIDDQRISRLQYNFKLDNTLEILRIELNDASREVLGYRSRTYGDYNFYGNRLLLFNLTSYSNDDTKNEYSPLDQLLLTNENYSYEVIVKFDENERQLTLVYPPCGPNSNCLQEKSLLRE